MGEAALEVVDAGRLLARARLDLVPLGAQPLGLPLRAAGELVVQAAVRREDAPVGGHILTPGRALLFRRLRRDADEDAGGERAGGRGVAPRRQYLAHLRDGEELARLRLADQRVHVEGARDQQLAVAV